MGRPMTPGGCMQTYSGAFDIARFMDDGETEDIRRVDITEGLAKLCRFNGGSKHFYSVAEHSIFVGQRMEEVTRKGWSEEARTNAIRWALLHDAHEVYLGDIVRPWRKFLPLPLNRWLIEVSKQLDKHIGAHFKVWPKWQDVAGPDNEVLAMERDKVLHPCPDLQWPRLPDPVPYEPHFWGPEEAAEKYDEALHRWGL